MKTYVYICNMKSGIITIIWQRILIYGEVALCKMPVKKSFHAENIIWFISKYDLTDWVCMAVYKRKPILVMDIISLYFDCWHTKSIVAAIMWVDKFHMYHRRSDTEYQNMIFIP